MWSFPALVQERSIGRVPQSPGPSGSQRGSLPPNGSPAPQKLFPQRVALAPGGWRAQLPEYDQRGAVLPTLGRAGHAPLFYVLTVVGL